MVAYSFRRQFVLAIRLGLGLDPVDPEPGARRPKRQTIRADRRRHARPGEELQLYTAMRTKQCELIGKARCTDVRPIVLQFSASGVTATVGAKKIGPRKMQAFAEADGFASIKDMHDFWMAEHGHAAQWHGVIIYWEPLT